MRQIKHWKIFISTAAVDSYFMYDYLKEYIANNNGKIQVKTSKKLYQSDVFIYKLKYIINAIFEQLN